VNVVSAGNAPWVISAGDPVATLEIVFQKQTVVLSCINLFTRRVTANRCGWS
jgi:hypothetical protein